jgi:hypothetical protein
VNAVKRAFISLPQHRRARGGDEDKYESGGNDVFVRISAMERAGQSPAPHLCSIIGKVVAQGAPMTDKSDAENDDVAAVRRGRDSLIKQIRISQGTSDRSKELIRQMDELLAKRGVKP